VKQIGQELGVQFILRGALRKASNRIRVTAELIDTSSDAAVWSDKLEHADDDAFDVIDDLSSAIAVKVVGRIEDEVLRRARRKSTSLFGAYELVLRGRMLLQRPEMSDKLEARKLFEQALQLDPDYAHAHVQLALTHVQQFFFDDSGQALDRANAIATEALLLDEEEPWCHMVLGLTHLHRRRFDLAVRHCQRAVALNPCDPGLVARLGLVLTDVGRPVEAIAAIEKAMALNPLNPDKYNDYMGLALYGARRYREALQVLQSLPDSKYYIHAWLAAVHVRLGDAEAARVHVQRAMALAPNFTVGRVVRMEPISDPEDLAHWTDAFTAAGFPP
jgi:adenylate cyclase